MSSTAPAGTQAYPEKIDAAVLKVAGVVVLGAIMSILDITVVNVALPHFQTDLATGPDPLQYSTVAWTVTGYTLALATVIPLTGWAADRFGTKRLYLTAVALFAIGSTLCAFAPSIEALIGFRVLQGLGGGMLMPLGMTIMTRAAGPQRMGRLMAILGVPMLLGPIGGPILGGWLIDNAHWLGRPSWTWIFLINLPIGAAALVYAWVVLPKDSAVPSESLDVVGLLLMSPGLALFLYGVSSIPDTGTILATKVLAPALVGIVLMAAFAWWSFKPEHPLLDLSLFTNRNFTVAALTMFLFAAAFFGGLLLVPTYFQQVRGEDTFTAGLLLAPQGIGALITMPIAGALVDKMPVGRIVPFGIALITGGMFALTQIDAETSYWGYIIPVLFVMGLGMGGTMMPLMTSALKTLTAHQVARLDAAQHHPAGRQLLRRRDHLGAADELHRVPSARRPGAEVRRRGERGHRPEPGPAAPRALPRGRAGHRSGRRPGARPGGPHGGGPLRPRRRLREHVLGLGRAVRAHPRRRALPSAQARGEPPARRGRGRRAGARGDALTHLAYPGPS
ncbi:DHA2 family efflux MFS transporter permease subunit [Janibacter sp. Y6]|uniref:DHA2 family efflux MFS transporter permease subunit n=1 Tax=Janibacter sp. Y6 TaxID=2913552 RepID=UPI0034A5433C